MAWYKTGTVAVTNGSTAVTGVGTDWIAGVGIGESFYGPDGKLYEIASLVSATSLTLGAVYLGATASGQAYQIIPNQSYIRDLAAQAAALVNNYGAAMTTAGQGRFADGAAAAPGISFTNDQNTGIYRAGADDMRLVAGGADQAKVTSAGLVVQDDKLSITGSTDATKVAKFEVDGFTAATTRTFTLPNVSTTLAGTHNKISDFAAVTSAELAAKVTDETGAGALVFASSPALTGVPTAPTAAVGTNTTQVATTAFAVAQIDSQTSLTAAASKIPVSDAASVLDPSWLENNQTFQRLVGAIAYATDLAGHAAGSPLVLAQATPSGTTAGNPGNVAFDSSYLYICTAKNVWKRVALTSF